MNHIVRFQRRLQPIKFPQNLGQHGFRNTTTQPQKRTARRSLTHQSRRKSSLRRSKVVVPVSTSMSQQSSVSSEDISEYNSNFNSNYNSPTSNLMNYGQGPKRRPTIIDISSGANHFLMLAINGEIWEMGVSKLGQRTAERLMKKYLMPHRVSFVTKPGTGKKVKFQSIACGAHHNLAISNENQCVSIVFLLFCFVLYVYNINIWNRLYSWGQNNYCQCGQDLNHNKYNNVIDGPKLVDFYETPMIDTNNNNNNNNKVNVKECSWKECIAKKHKKVTKNVKIVSVYGGTHFSVALDENDCVWTFGRNASVQLGRDTYREPSNDPNIEVTELTPDLARKVTFLDGKIDWIGCGTKFWFAHNKFNGNLYAFGDSADGCCGVGYWRSARGRTVFDKSNLDLVCFVSFFFFFFL